MAYTDTWNSAFEALPADANAVSEGADRIRDLKLAIRERLAKDHYLVIAGTDADHGEHVKITFQAQSEKPAAVANKGFLYIKDASAKVELFWEDEDGDEVQLTTGGVLNAPVTLGANVFTGQQTFKETVDTVYDITDAAAFDIDPVNGNIQTVTLGANRTPAATNFAAGQAVILGISDGTAYAITWTTVAPTWVKPGGTAVAPTLAATGYTWVLLWMVGAVIYGCEVGQP